MANELIMNKPNSHGVRWLLVQSSPLDEVVNGQDGDDRDEEQGRRVADDDDGGDDRKEVVEPELEVAGKGGVANVHVFAEPVQDPTLRRRVEEAHGTPQDLVQGLDVRPRKSLKHGLADHGISLIVLDTCDVTDVMSPRFVNC